MKTLLLMRHAKSDHADGRLTDHDRPLNARGERTAPRMGELLREQQLIPDVILASTARRAVDTAQRVAAAVGWAGDIDRRRALYLSSPHDYVEVLRALPDEPARVLVVGHNPTLEALVSLWNDEDVEFPTAAVAHFEVSLEHWSDLRLDATLILRHLWRPRELDAD
ncbi:MAG: histidine phosphatase family protein [Pirellulales bacterium]